MFRHNSPDQRNRFGGVRNSMGPVFAEFHKQTLIWLVILSFVPVVSLGTFLRKNEAGTCQKIHEKTHRKTHRSSPEISVKPREFPIRKDSQTIFEKTKGNSREYKNPIRKDFRNPIWKRHKWNLQKNDWCSVPLKHIQDLWAFQSLEEAETGKSTSNGPTQMLIDRSSFR